MKKFLKLIAVALVIISVFAASLTSCGIAEAKYTLGLAAIDTDKGQIAALVLLDDSERIVLCRIDEFDVSKGETRSKKELGDDYGMLSDWGSSLAEWDDQIAHLERQLIGKTITELAFVKGDDADIKAGCTVYIDNYTRAVAKAAALATEGNDSFTALGEVTIALTFAVEIPEGGEGYTAVASGVALERGYLVAQDSIISHK